jgi:peptidoglycan hydrolase CwlO-like protein
MQLELFPQQSKDEIEDLKERYERLRKSQHARITGLQKEINQLKSELEFIKANICKGLLL